MTTLDIRLSVVAPTGSGLPVDLLLRTPVGATAADLRPGLAEASGYAGRSPRLFVAGEPVPDDVPIGTAPLLQGALVTLDDPGMKPDAAVPGVLELQVVGGPDCGHAHRLVPGDHIIGRGPEATIRVEDPDLSRRHVRLRVRHTAVTVEDLGSTNGTTADGEPVTGTAREVSTATVLRLGSTTMVLRVPTAARAAAQPDGLGHVMVNRSPRLLPPLESTEVTLPAPPPRRDPTRVPLVATLVPVVLAVPMAVLAHSPLYLLFGLMSPMILLGNVVGDRRRGRREHALAVEAHERASAAAWRDVERALRAEATRRHTQLPDHVELLATVAGPLARVWERRRTDEDVLLLRLGLADLPSRVTIVDPGEDHHRSTPELSAVPVGVALTEVGVLGVAGAREPVTGLARGLVAQTCGWHSPRDVRLVVLAADAARAGDWSWTAHLPHTRPAVGEDCRALLGVLSATGDQVRRRVAELAAIVAERSGARGAGAAAPWTGPRVVVVLAGAHRLRAVPGMAGLLEHGPAVGVHFICLDEDAARLPLEARATVDVVGRGSTRLRVQVSGAAPVTDVVADQVSAGWAERFARALAPLRDATPDDDTTEVPDEARLLDVLPFDATDATAVAAQWSTSPRSTMAVLGVAAAGPYAVDLRREGPHLLVGGTTGAGKSELLQTVISSLALANRPDQLSFVLVDYKGGAAFKDCAELPHTVGLVTDLDAHLAERALTSLRAELTRRERVLREAGVKDIEDQHARAAAGQPVLPRLVLVIDEFRVLAEELPAFLEGVLRIASVGRSLGVHLVLATQRPAGVVTADIKANVALRIALRVRDRLDSEDLVEAPDAAAISERTAGRALLRSGAGPLVQFQTARVGGHGPARAAPTVVAVPVPADAWGDPPAPPGVAVTNGATDLARIVATTRAAARDLGVDPVASPWLPPLPARLHLADLEQREGLCAPWAVIDRPGSQRQDVLAWDLDHDGHLAIAGSPRTGRTTALRTLAGSLAMRAPVADLHLHALDGGSGGLRPLAQLPHAGVVVTRDDLPRAARLVARLEEEVSRRQALLGELGVGSVTEHRRASGLAPGPDSPLPYLVLLVDGWEAWSQAFESVDHGRPTEQLLRILREGQAAGIRVALTGDRSILLSQVASAVPDKLVLRLSDPTDLVMAGIPAASVPPDQPPGRAVRTRDHAEVQVALLDGDGSGSAQARALEELGARVTGRPGTSQDRPMRIEPLPLRVAAGTLAVSGRPDCDPRHWALVGVGGDDAGPVGVDLASTPAVLVAGPHGSGRSSTLATMARHLTAAGRPVAAVTPRRSSPVAGLAGEVAHLVGPHDREALTSLLGRHDDLVVVVDDAELILDTPCEEVLVEWLRHGDRGPSVLCAGATAELAGLFRGLTTEVRKHRTGVLLQPAGLADGDLFGIRVRSGNPGPPGRGLLVSPGRVMPVQVALPA